MCSRILNPCAPDSNLGNGMIFFLWFFKLFIFFCLFLSLLLQCKFANSTLLSLLSFSYFITPYDAQASSAFSALITITGLLWVLSKYRLWKYAKKSWKHDVKTLFHCTKYIQFITNISTITQWMIHDYGYLDENYHKNSKYWDRMAREISADPDQTAPEQSDHDLHCLLLHKHLFNILLQWIKNTVQF